MGIIRGETVQQIALLSSSGELLSPEEHAFVDLAQEESQKAYQKGVEEGEKSGYERAQRESGVFLDLLQNVSRKILEQKKNLLEQLKPEIIEFSLAVCEQVLRRELSQPEAFEKLIHSLLVASQAELKDEKLEIVLNPEDLEMLEGREKVSKARFIPDPIVKRGDCRIETKAGLLHFNIARELSDLQAKVFYDV